MTTTAGVVKARSARLLQPLPDVVLPRDASPLALASVWVLLAASLF